jgi:hypothetical protein
MVCMGKYEDHMYISMFSLGREIYFWKNVNMNELKINVFAGK